MRFDLDDVDDDDVAYFVGGLNEFGRENEGAFAPNLILIHLSLNPSSFSLFDGIIDGVDVLVFEDDENDDFGDIKDGFDGFDWFGDGINPSSSLYLLLLLNLILFIIFVGEINGGFSLDVGGINDGLFGDLGDILVEFGLFEDDIHVSSNSSLSLSLSSLFIDKFGWLNGGETVFVFGDDNDDMIGDFGVDLVGFCLERNGADPAPILLPLILLFLV